MDAFTFLVEMTKALAWPAVALTVAAYARKPVSVLVKDLSLWRLKVAGVEAEFSRKWDEEAQHVVAVADLPAARKPPPKGFLGIFGRLSDDSTGLADVIAGSWATVEKRVREAANSALGPREGVPFSEILHELVQAGTIAPGTAEGLRGLEQLRNLAVNAPRDETLAKRVPEFTSMAEAMLWTFEHDVKRELPTEIRSANP